VGIPLSNNRARIDIGVIRSLRRADLPEPVKENAWTVSLGILVRP
jgi:hypothetical protein